MPRSALLILSVITLLVPLTGRSAIAQFENLIRGVPESTNVLAIANSDAILHSPIGKKENCLEPIQNLFHITFQSFSSFFFWSC